MTFMAALLEKTKRELIVATCQFPVSADIKRNEHYIQKLLAEAKAKDAEIAHFSECCLSGYAGIDFQSFRNLDEHFLRCALDGIIRFSEKHRIGIIVGSHHFEKNNKKPYNCLWLINDGGIVVDRYDKRFLTGKPGKQDHLYYRPGYKTAQFQIKGISCGMLICHEWRYPELYRAYKRQGVEIIFQSWYDGRLSPSEFREEGKELGSLITGTVRGNAANNYLWISASNTSQRESSFASFVVRPDGRIAHRLKRNVTGVLISKIHFDTSYSDPSGQLRDRAYFRNRS